MKWCPKCKEFKPKQGFHSGYCPSCFKEYRAEWQATHKEKMLGIKKRAIRLYGGKCSSCGEKDPAVLTMYPPGPQGEKALLYALEEQHWPKDHTLLCYNCRARARQGTT
jgi:hypothetical protein